jgi:anion-transporting  ArsA/GET3 family ATPase
VLLVEIDGQSSASRLLSDRVIGYEPVPIAERIAALSITLTDALREYARLRLRMRLVADRLVGHQIIDQFAQAAPGFRDLLVLGKLWWLASATDSHGRPEWDAIIVDAPATGHGLGLLGMAGTIARMFPVGPIAAQAVAIDTFVRDAKRCGVVLVAVPEELPVTETLELHTQLRERGIDVAATVLNSVLIDRFSAADAQACAAAREAMTGSGASSDTLRHALDTVLLEHARCNDHARERERLEQGLAADVALLPHMFVPALGVDHVTALAEWMTAPGQRMLIEQLAGAADGPAAAAAVHDQSGAQS